MNLNRYKQDRIPGYMGGSEEVIRNAIREEHFLDQTQSNFFGIRQKAYDEGKTNGFNEGVMSGVKNLIMSGRNQLFIPADKNAVYPFGSMDEIFKDDKSAPYIKSFLTDKLENEKLPKIQKKIDDALKEVEEYRQKEMKKPREVKDEKEMWKPHKLAEVKPEDLLTDERHEKINNKVESGLKTLGYNSKTSDISREEFVEDIDEKIGKLAKGIGYDEKKFNSIDDFRKTLETEKNTIAKELGYDNKGSVSDFIDEINPKILKSAIALGYDEKGEETLSEFTKRIIGEKRKRYNDDLEKKTNVSTRRSKKIENLNDLIRYGNLITKNSRFEKIDSAMNLKEHLKDEKAFSKGLKNKQKLSETKGYIQDVKEGNQIMTGKKFSKYKPGTKTALVKTDKFDIINVDQLRKVVNKNEKTGLEDIRNTSWRINDELKKSDTIRDYRTKSGNEERTIDYLNFPGVKNNLTPMSGSELMVLLKK